MIIYFMRRNELLRTGTEYPEDVISWIKSASLFLWLISA